MKTIHQGTRLGLGALAFAISAQLHAQAGIQEVVVTAQKRSESAQEIPIAIDVIAGNDFIREGVRDVKDIQKMSTELEINSNVGMATVIGVRGMQQNQFAATGDSLTAVHLDGAYVHTTWGLNGLMFDLERVEVLAGPQGTLYGRNSAAGAVNIISRKPGREFEANGMVEYGSLNTVRVGGGVSVPMGETFALRVAGQKLTRDPLFDDGGSEVDQWNGRMVGVWTPDDRNELTMTFDYLSFNNSNDPTTLYAVNPNARLANGNVPTSVSAYLNSPTLSDPYKVKAYETQRGLVYVGQGWLKNWGAMAQYTHDWDDFSMTVQYSRREIWSLASGATRTLAQYSSNIFPKTIESDVAELRFTSNGDGAFEWVAGLFYTQASAKGPNFTPIADNSPDPYTGIDAAWCPCSSGFYPNGGNMYSYAAFGQTTWTPESNPQLHVTGGLRYTFDWKDASLGYFAGNVPIFVFGLNDMPAAVQPLFSGVRDLAAGDNDRTWNAMQWRLGVEYELTDRSMIYGSIATGYKSGGLTFGPTPELKPEDLLAFEIGTKNRFLDNTLQVNASAWYYDYQDLEASVNRALGFSVVLPNGTIQDTAPSTGSVGKVALAGLSSDIDWYFTDADKLGLSFTYTYSKIKDGTEIKPIGQPNAGSRNVIFNEGERQGDAPEWQVLGRYGHTFTFSNGATLNPQLKYQWQSEKYDAGLYRPQAYYPNNRNTRETAIPAFGLLDVSLRFAPAGDRWDVTAYVNNATDELNIKSLTYDPNPAGATLGQTLATLGEPRTYGVILTAKF